MLLGIACLSVLAKQHDECSGDDCSRKTEHTKRDQWREFVCDCIHHVQRRESNEKLDDSHD